MTGARKPQAFTLEPESETPKPKRNPRALTAPKVRFEDEGERPLAVPPAPHRRKRFRWSLLFASALAALVSLYAGLSITRLIEDLFARSPVFGWIALGLAGLAALAAVMIIVREAWALARLSRIEQLQSDAARALNTNDTAAAARTLDGLKRLYAGRADAAWGMRAVAEHAADIMDPSDRVKHADRVLLRGFDGEAHRIIARAARRIALLTTVTPAAALDILFVAAQNLRMMREVATLYGGRPSTLASFRLARMVVGHLAVTGGLALSDSVMQHVLGKGLIGRLSARFGEGAVNGILTARVGLAAIDVCRPIPQEPSAKETLASLTKELFKFGEEDADGKDNA